MERVRLLSVADVDAYCALRRAMLFDSPLAFTASPGSDFWSDEAVVRERLARPEYAIVGGFVDGALAGVAGIAREVRPKMAHRATVWGVWVAPASRGLGLGEAIMRKIIDVARNWPGVRAVCLSAGAGQMEARRLYERVGFVQWGVEPGAMMYEGKLYDEVYLQLWMK